MVPQSVSSGGGPVAPQIAVVFAYYENPSMLELQWAHMAGFSETHKRALEVIVVDDGSPESPAAGVVRPEGLPRHAIYRIAEDIPWNQDAARNIGAHEALSEWVLLTDIDHVVPEETIAQLLELDKDSRVFYTFGRTKFFTDDMSEPHPNSYFMTKALYWTIGGHDEDFRGIYGKDYLFRRRAFARSQEVHLPTVTLARVGSSSVADASTRTITRRNTRRAMLRGYVMQVLKALRLMRGIQTLRSPYSREV